MLTQDHGRVVVQRNKALSFSEGEIMSVLGEMESFPNASDENKLTLNDRLVMIDIAYNRQDRGVCAYLIEDLYSHFDSLEFK